MLGRFLIAAVAVVAAAAAHAGTSESAAEFYAGRTVQLVVGGPDAGPNHEFSGVVARHIARFIPGNPKIRVRTMPGETGRTAARWLYSVAANDGSVIGAVNPEAMLDPLIADRTTRRTIKYDPLRFEYLGSGSSSVQVCIIRKDSPALTFEETRKQPLIMGATRDGGPTLETALVLMRVLGARFRMIGAYRDLRQTMRALEEGEVHGVCGVDFARLTVLRPDLVVDDKVGFLLQYGLDGRPELTRRGVPMMWHFTRSATDRPVLELLASKLVFARPFVMPPGTPKDRVGVLRSALERTLKDPKFLSDAREVGFEVTITPGRRVDALIRKAFSAPKDVVTRAREAHQG